MNFLTKMLFGLQQLSFAHSARKYIRDDRAVVYSRDPFSLHGLLKSNYKIYWEVHNFPQNIKSGFYKRILGRIDGLLTITTGLKKDLEEHYDGDILVVPDAVDLDEFDIDISKTEARKKVDLPAGGNVVTYVGHLYPWKGVDVLAKSIKFIQEDALVVIVGGLKGDRNRIKKHISQEDLKRFVFKDYVTHDKVPFYLKASDCLVLTGKEAAPIAKQYTSPLKVFEYMASKKPIVAQSLPSFREILDTDNSVLVKPGDPRDLARGINQVLNESNVVDKITTNAFNDVQQHTWKKRAKKIIQFIK